MSAGQIIGEHPGRQSEFGGIGAFDDFLLLLEFQDGHDRAENLLAHDGHVVAALVEYRGRDEVSLRQFARRHPHAARQDARALGPSALYIREHLVHVLFGHQGADLSLGIHRIADSHRVRRA